METAPVAPVKLFVAALHSDPSNFDAAMDLLVQEWGAIDFVSEDFPFDVTDYYEKEMGKNLLRRLVSFERLISPEQIVICKLFSNVVENRFQQSNSRTINLDPGYLDYYKLVLASTKYGGQKIYLGSGIYADMTLVMYKGVWDSFPWGFPDFKSGRYDDALSAIRNIYKEQMKARS